MNAEKTSKKDLWSLVLTNLKPAITVAIVSIPLSIAISIASGAGPVPGVITGFWATIIGGILGGSKYNVMGSAGALTSILFVVSAGSIAGKSGPWILPILAIMTGLFILAAYYFKGEKYLKYIPSSVVLGFSAGVAVAIASTQIKEAFGLSFVHTHGEVLRDVFTLLKNVMLSDWITFAVFFTGFLFLLIWKKSVKSIPGVIPLVLIGIALGFFSRETSLESHIPTIADRYENLHFTLFAFPAMENLAMIFKDLELLVGMVKVSALIAVVAILETLITARVGDKITSTRFDESREMKGLAFANLASGIMGGLPATGVFVRTGLNIKSGATHNAAAVIAGVLTGLGAIILFPALQFIPMAIIAAILYMTALGLIEVSQFKNMLRSSRQDFLIAMTVAVLILIFDAGIAIAVGGLMSLILFIEKTSNGNAELLLNLDGKLVKKTTSGKIDLITEDYDAAVYSIAGFCSYLDAQNHVNRLLKMAKTNKRLRVIVLRMRNIYHFDLDAIESLAFAITELEKRNIQVAVASCSSDLEKRLIDCHTYKEFNSLKKRGLFFPKSSIAITSLSKIA